MYGQSPAKEQAEDRIELSFDQQVFKKYSLFIPGMEPGSGIGKGGILKTKAHREVGDKNAENGNTPEGIDQVNAFSGLNGCQGLHQVRWFWLPFPGDSMV